MPHEVRTKTRLVRDIKSHYCGAIIPSMQVFGGSKQLCFAVCRQFKNPEQQPDRYRVVFIGGTNSDHRLQKSEGLFSTVRREGREEGGVDILSSKAVYWQFLPARSVLPGDDDHLKCFSIVRKCIGVESIPLTFDGIERITEFSGEQITRPVWQPITMLYEGHERNQLFQNHMVAGVMALWHLMCRNPVVWESYREFMRRRQHMLRNVLGSDDRLEDLYRVGKKRALAQMEAEERYLERKKQASVSAVCGFV